ncbi:hypothetical protein THASP1DRAFT_29130 [Thamnocephalis sphaerospora]|uniref:Uncharacterized protein n=1 Tax=Thamnocephalis sphaerospora TaxID=78915 RepID=A0A4P9XSG2_9FUNG|nr:hypothetical protein THASP1DRAFT_29130 [Thamnocephalis sphaerospora]|eukprot:RKP09073.1 hypothetical protein THASP1DRAFT_29130 [Thamnocephalis sphaerospora]
MSLFHSHVPLNVPRDMRNSAFVVLLTVMFWVFFSNARQGCALLYARRHTRGTRLLVPVLNIIPNVIGGVICFYVEIQRAWPGFANCDTILALDATAISFGTASIAAILFIRVYYAWMRHKWLLQLGGVLIFATFFVGVSGFFTLSIYMDKNGSCLVKMDAYWTLAKFVVDIVTNITLSGLYLYVVSRALRGGFSTALYVELRQEGLVSAFFVVLSAIITAVAVLLDLIPENSTYVYGVDLLVSATLVNRMLCRHRNSSSHMRTAGQLQFRRAEYTR